MQSFVDGENVERKEKRERDVLVQKLICPRLACDDNFDLLPHARNGCLMSVADICMIHSCVRE